MIRLIKIASLSSLIATIALVAAAAATGCNTYDPTLGPAPFRCGTSEPRCPDGFECMTMDENTSLCVGGGDGGNINGTNGTNGGGVDCDSDMVLEPNNDTQRATATQIPTQQEDSLVGLAICNSDVDYFRFDTESGFLSNVQARVTYQSTRGALVVQIVNNLDTEIVTASPAAGDPDTLLAEIEAVPGGQTFYVKVSGAEVGVQNNYNLTINAVTAN